MVVTATQQRVRAMLGVVAEMCRQYAVTIAEPKFLIAGTLREYEVSQIMNLNARSGGS